MCSDPSRDPPVFGLPLVYELLLLQVLVVPASADHGEHSWRQAQEHKQLQLSAILWGPALLFWISH